MFSSEIAGCTSDTVPDLIIHFLINIAAISKKEFIAQVINLKTYNTERF
jgi:hypothetical protein